MGIVLNWSTGYNGTVASVDDRVSDLPTLADGVHDVMASHVNTLADICIELEANQADLITTVASHTATLATISPVTVREIDGSPSVTPINTIEFQNGTLTDMGGGVIRVNPGASMQSAYDASPDILQDATGGIQITRPTGTGDSYALYLSNTGTDLSSGNALLLVEQNVAASSGVAAKFSTHFSSQSGAVHVTDSGGLQTLEIGKDSIRADGSITIGPYGSGDDDLGDDLTLSGGSGGQGVTGPGQAGGVVTIQGGTGGSGAALALAGGNGGGVSITGGNGGSPFDTDGSRGDGGAVTITGGTAGFSVGTDSGDGGNVLLVGGDGGGDGGTGGSVYLVPGSSVSNGSIYIGTTVEAEGIESGMTSVTWTHRGTFWAHEEVRVGNFSVDGSLGSFIRMYSIDTDPSSVGAEQGVLYALIDDASGPDLYYRMGTTEGAGGIWQITGGATNPSAIGTAADPGVVSELARIDHIHTHGSHTDPTNHAVATTADNGFMSSTDKSKLDIIVSGTYTPTFSPSDAGLNPSIVDVWMYQRVGNIVKVAGTLSVQSIDTPDFPFPYIEISLPIATASASSEFVSGSFTTDYNGELVGGQVGGEVDGVSAQARMLMKVASPPATDLSTFKVEFMYRIT